MPILKDAKVKKILEKRLVKACQKADVPLSKYKVVFMGATKPHKSMKSGYFVKVQNFTTSFQKARASKDNRYFRYNFKCIQFENRIRPLFEISKWMPSYGGESDAKVIWRSDDKRYKGDFNDLLVMTMKIVKYKF
jgi:hypothetical protein